jgi:hypothetical protein
MQITLDLPEDIVGELGLSGRKLCLKNGSIRKRLQQ